MLNYQGYLWESYRELPEFRGVNVEVQGGEIPIVPGGVNRYILLLPNISSIGKAQKQT